MVLLVAEVTAAIIAGLASLAVGAVNYFSAKKTNEQSIDFARESAATAQQNTKDLMDYNSPSYQMSRIVQAGLNPNIAYDNLDTPVPTGAQASQPSLKVPSLTFGVDEALKVAQINRLNAAADNETEKTAAEVRSLYKGNELKDAQMEALYASAAADTQSVLESNSRIMLLGEERRSKFLDNLFKAKTFNDRVETVSAEMHISKTSAEYQERYIAARILGLKSQADYYLSESKLNAKQAKMVESLTSVYDENAHQLHQYNHLLDQQVDAADIPVFDNGENLPYGTYSAYRGYRQKVFTSEMVELQNELLQRFGATEENVKIILGISESIRNFSDAVSNFLPSYEKSSDAGVVSRKQKSILPIK